MVPHGGPLLQHFKGGQFGISDSTCCAVDVTSCAFYFANWNVAKKKARHMYSFHIHFLFTFRSPFLTISLCRAGHYLCHPVFSILCHLLLLCLKCISHCVYTFSMSSLLEYFFRVRGHSNFLAKSITKV